MGNHQFDFNTEICKLLNEQLTHNSNLFHSNYKYYGGCTSNGIPKMCFQFKKKFFLFFFCCIILLKLDCYAMHRQGYNNTKNPISPCELKRK